MPPGIRTTFEMPGGKAQPRTFPFEQVDCAAVCPAMPLGSWIASDVGAGEA